MNEEKDSLYMAGIIIGVLAGLAVWGILIPLEAAGVIELGWIIVLSSFAWVAWLVFTLSGLVAAVLWLLSILKRRLRAYKVARRIIRQAEAAGVWDSPQLLGGRALELKAWIDYKIKRKPDETDYHLRNRYLAAANKEYEKKQRGAKNE